MEPKRLSSRKVSPHSLYQEWTIVTTDHYVKQWRNGTLSGLLDWWIGEGDEYLSDSTDYACSHGMASTSA